MEREYFGTHPPHVHVLAVQFAGYFQLFTLQLDLVFVLHFHFVVFEEQIFELLVGVAPEV